MKIIHWAILLVGLLSTSDCAGQIDLFKIDMERIHHFFADHKYFQIEAKYQLYQGHQTRVVVDEMMAITKRNGSQYYHRLAEIESISNDQQIIVLDHEDKSIFIDVNKRRPEELMLGYNVENTIRLSEGLSMIQNEKELRTYKMSLRSLEYEGMEISFNPQNNMLKKVVLYYRVPQKLSEDQLKEDTPRLVITFNDVNTEKLINNELFSFSTYVQNINNQFEPTAAYRSYTLVDNTLANK